MESNSEGKQVLSDIEQSIQNALALFNSKDLGGGISQLYVIDDPIVSLHDTKRLDPERNTEVKNSCKSDFVKINPPPEAGEHVEDNQQYYDALPFTNIKMSQESVVLPFLDNPIKNTIEEMQRVLNTKCDMISPRSQPQPSPEEILNLYSQDLGICLSTNASPRGDIGRHFDENDFNKVKQNKKDKKNLNKKNKQPKLSKEKKTEPKKGKPTKSETMANQDNKLRELMNIYGCADKMKKPKSDSTLGSKSGVSRNASIRKLTHVNNSSSKASSIAVSRKSKKLKYKYTNDLDINLSEGDITPLEKSSRLSTKRKTKQRTNYSKPLKKPNLKRKIGAKLSNDDLELKVSKSCQASREDNYNKHKTSSSKYFDSANAIAHKKHAKQKTVNQIQKNYLNRNRGLSSNETEGSTKNNNLNVLNGVTNNKEQHGMKNKSIFPDNQGDKSISFFNSQYSLDVEKSQNTLNKNPSEENKLNKKVSLKDGVHTYHSYQVGNKEVNTQVNSDIGNEAMMEQQAQLHYTLPTQSSRSKEVDRFLNGHYQNLPFVIGQSTNKSHNLWVNIQEALSLIKHNIPQTVQVSSVNDVESERPLSVLSKLTTKSAKKPHQCPALMNEGLYDIPETIAEGEEGIKSWEDHPDCIQANLDPNFSHPRCSCFPQSTLSYRKVLRQIFGGGEDSMDSIGARDDIVLDQDGDNYSAELRKVLISFTEEFEELNNKYEKLISDPNSSKEEIQRLEMCLETKEEEIKEIIARINEMKELNEKSRLEGGQSRGVGPYSLEPYKSTTSVRLVQTLRRVQQFKEALRSRPSIPYLARSACAKSTY